MLAFRSMRWLIRLFVTMAVAAGVVYLLFFVDFGGQNLGSHLAEIWRSPVVQGKVKVVEKSIEQRLAKRLVTTPKQMAASADGAKVAADDDQISLGDRRSLGTLVGRIAHSHH